ncbi:hypothetical protein AA103587_2602 [Gluconobacter kanchanaburiensis NBRC 103587]|nr:hypothetical protein AA103587_2602 [Gluconobacter kanchanaburiensis NBRC 103587]
MTDDRGNKNKRRHSKLNTGSGLVNFIHDQVRAPFDIAAIPEITQADTHPGNRQSEQKIRMGYPKGCRKIQQPEKKSACTADTDGQCGKYGAKQQKVFEAGEKWLGLGFKHG